MIGKMKFYMLMSAVLMVCDAVTTESSCANSGKIAVLIRKMRRKIIALKAVILVKKIRFAAMKILPAILD